MGPQNIHPHPPPLKNALTARHGGRGGGGRIQFLPRHGGRGGVYNFFLDLKNLLSALLRSVLLHDFLGVHPRQKRRWGCPSRWKRCEGGNNKQASFLKAFVFSFSAMTCSGPESQAECARQSQSLAAQTLKTLTSLKKEVRPFFLGDNSI